MAKVELSSLIKSMSGTISKRRLADGTVVCCVVTKKGHLYMQTHKPRTKPVSVSENARREKFGIIAAAIVIVRRTLSLPSDPETQKQTWGGLTDVYELMKRNKMEISPENLANRYCSFLK